MPKAPHQLYTILTAMVGVSLLILVAFRAYDLSITFDEVWTFDLANQSIIDIMTAERNFTSANNHILNTILIKPGLYLFGHHVWVLRLPNVLAYIVYFLSTVSIVRTIAKDVKLQFVGILLLNLHPYLLDFFSLSRGYGLALAFQTLSIAWILVYVSNKRMKYLLGSFAMATLAVLANFTWLNYFLPLWAAVNIVFIVQNIEAGKAIFGGFLKQNFNPFLCSIIVASFSIIPIQFLRDQDEFKWGADAWIDSFHTFAKDFNYTNSFGWAVAMQIIISLLFLASIVLLIKQYRKKSAIDSSLFLLTSIIFFIIIASISQRFLLHTMYMDGRKATMYIPLIMSLAIAAIAFFKEKIKAANYVAAGIGMAAIIHFFFAIKIDSVREWWFDADTKQVISYMNTHSTDSSISVNMNWEFTSSFEYYNRFYYQNKFVVTKVEKSAINTQTPTYFYVFENNIPMIASNYSIIKSHKDLYALLQKK